MNGNFCDNRGIHDWFIMGENQIVTRKNNLQNILGRIPVLLAETFQNWGKTQRMSVISVKPKTVSEVEKVVKAIKDYNEEYNESVSLRCVGDQHSWSPLFPDDGNVLMYISNLNLEDNKRIILNEVCFGLYMLSYDYYF